MAEKTNTFLLSLCGLPASGKSTFARMLALELDRSAALKAIVVASDTVRGEMPALSRAFFPDVENSVRRLSLARVRDALKEGFPVIFDDLNYYRSMRRQLYTLARDLRAAYFLVHLSTPEKTCLEHNAARGSTVPDTVIITDAVRFDPPGDVAWDEAYLQVDAEHVTEESVARLAAGLLARAPRFVPPIEEPGTGPLEKTRREELDILSRRAVGELYKTRGGTVDSKALHKERLRLIKDAVARDLNDRDAMKFFERGLAPLFEK